MKGGYLLQPEPQSCLPPTHSSHAWPLAVATLPPTGNATVEDLPSCFRLSPPGPGERSRPGRRHCARRDAVTASHPSAQPQVMLPAVGSVLVRCQHPAPTLPGTWPHSGTHQVCCRGGGARTLKEPGLQAAGGQGFPRATGDGLSPQSDLPPGLVQLAAIAPAICAQLATGGWALCTPPPPRIVLAELGQQKPLIPGWLLWE
uniref:Uncharacterized protein n=1 Tax=Myotis myotis TaxID=51298 RepID=A0A7J7TTU7_MYOMY|nr:hypothetical protein mMyoMyo1_009007 [Myotis myotis]